MSPSRSFSMAFLAVVLLAAALSAQQWQQNPASGRFYALTPELTWHQAETRAVDLGGHLATVRNQAERDWLRTVFGTQLWIGLNDEASEGAFIWSSGLPLIYQSWAPGQPSGGAGVHFVSTGPDGWNDVPAAETRPGIVEVSDLAAYRIFGTGCAGTVGVPVLEAAPGSLPHLDQPFTVRLSNLPAGFFGGLAYVLLGFSDSDWEGIPLPVDLTSVGLIHCTGYVSVDASFLVATSGGTAQWTLDIPNQPILLGMHFFNQALVEDGLANPFGAVVSNAAEGIIGSARREILEDFEFEANLDRDLSSGHWGTDVDPEGQATFGPIGGDGSHGAFSLNLLTQLDSEMIRGVEYEVYALDTDRVVIPGINTTDGRPVIVTDGVFRFSSFVLPPRTKVVFRGSHPPQFHVRGLVDIAGILDLGGADVPVGFDPDDPLGGIISAQPMGQPGAVAGAGGGDGGAGGDKPDGLGLQSRFNGQDGEGARVLAGHAYASIAANTGGKGSLMHPATGLASDVVFNLPPGFPFPFQSGMVASGGGGGGLLTPGADGRIDFHISPRPIDRGTDGLGGAGFPDLLPVPGEALSHEHFLIPGAGGGGGGGHPIRSFRHPILWNAGGGGAGGGGAILVRAGHGLVMGPASQILVTGGSGGVYDLTNQFTNVPPPAPGGGGSGGAIVLQCANPDRIFLSGLMDVRGGRGTAVFSIYANMSGGDGSQGLIRLETPLPLPSLGAVEPPFGPNRTGELVEIDDRVAFQSLWYDTGKLLPPNFLHYLLDVEIDGVPMTYSDDQVNFPHTRLAGPGEPVLFRVQGAILDPATGQPDPQNHRPWRFYVGDRGLASGQLGLTHDTATAVRFLMVLDRSVLGAGVEVVVKQLRIVFDT